MATMEELVNDVTTELRYGSGVSVQIHLEPSIVANINRCYRTLMKTYIWRDYYHVNQLVIDSFTGQSVAPVDSFLTSFSNIIAVYLENSSKPLPYAPVMTNPTLIRRPALVATNNSQIFTIYPLSIERNATLISKFYSEVDFEMEDEVPFYRDLLALCAAYQLSEKAGTNPELTQSLKKQYTDLVKTYRVEEMQDFYQMNPHVGQVPADWWVV